MRAPTGSALAGATSDPASKPPVAGGDGPSPGDDRGRSHRGLTKALAGSVAVAVVVSQRRSLLSAVGRIGRVSPVLLGLALLLEVVSLAAAGELQRRLLDAGGVRAGLGSVLALTWASGAVAASLPAGAAASAVYTYRHLTRRGTSSQVAGWLLAATGIVSAASLALLTIAGAQLRGLLSRCTVEDAVEVAALVGTVATSIGLLACATRRSGAIGQRTARLRRLAGAARKGLGLRTPSASEGFPVIGLRRRQWAAVVLFGLVNWTADCAVLAVSMVAIGAPIPWRGLLLAYALSQIAAAIPILPGSIGIAEGSLVVVLVCAGVHTSDALAAALVYRLASFWLQLPPGWVAWACLRKARPFDSSSGVRSCPAPSLASA